MAYARCDALLSRGRSTPSPSLSLSMPRGISARRVSHQKLCRTGVSSTTSFAALGTRQTRGSSMGDRSSGLAQRRPRPAFPPPLNARASRNLPQAIAQSPLPPSPSLNPVLLLRIAYNANALVGLEGGATSPTGDARTLSPTQPKSLLTTDNLSNHLQYTMTAAFIHVDTSAFSQELAFYKSVLKASLAHVIGGGNGRGRGGEGKRWRGVEEMRRNRMAWLRSGGKRRGGGSESKPCAPVDSTPPRHHLARHYLPTPLLSLWALPALSSSWPHPLTHGKSGEELERG